MVGPIRLLRCRHSSVASLAGARLRDLLHVAGRRRVVGELLQPGIHIRIMSRAEVACTMQPVHAPPLVLVDPVRVVIVPLVARLMRMHRNVRVGHLARWRLMIAVLLHAVIRILLVHLRRLLRLLLLLRHSLPRG